MSNARPESASEDQEKKSGPNLVLIYGLIALGFLLAFAAAAMIVWPFYVRR
jgi:hypothetical protein